MSLISEMMYDRNKLPIDQSSISARTPLEIVLTR